ncbi:hypothetical protein DL96DRAFT_915310 [Flagelloscypha sp. PMI_526]|nr:hypothetical protein DL96DRAFT_915310 [Flagelloscypha sp. PMI_526]
MGQIAEAQLICVRCSTLTCRIMLCANCNDSLPIRLEFTPDNRLSRRERTEPGLQPDPSTVKGLILAAESQVGQYEHLITQLQRSADQLKSYISYQKAKISPIRKLPLEMLATVFSLICSSNNAAKVYSGELPALRLSHVSTQWRRLSLSSPSLWSHLHFAHRPRRPRRLRKLLVDPETSRMEVLSIYLTHSRAQALSIYFWMNSSAARARPLARALADHSSRWQDLQICVHDIPLFPSSIRGRLRSLQKLSLLGPGLDLANPYEHFSLCPVLTEVGLKNQRLPNFTLPTSLIRDLSYDSCLPTDLRALETFASSLRTLGLSATYTNHPDEAGNSGRLRY